MKFVTLNSIVCTIFIIAAAQVYGLLYNSFGMDGKNDVLITSIWALIIPTLGVGMMTAIYIYQIIVSAKHNLIRANNFIFVIMTVSALMTAYPLLNTFFDIRIIDKIYEITGLYIFSNTPSMYISFLFGFLFLSQLYVQLRKNKYVKRKVMKYNNNYF